MRLLLAGTLLSLLALTPSAIAAAPQIVTRPYHAPQTPQSSEGAFWRIDRGFDSYLRIKNVLLNSSLKVTPVLYMADGHEVDLSPITLDPAGVASINLRTALADAGPAVAAHSSAYGMAGVKYQWGWSAVLATVQSIDEVESITFHSSLGADGQTIDDPSSAKTAHTIKGLWWAPHSTVSGFLALVNTSKTAVPAQVVFSDAQNQPIATRTIPVEGHATALLDLEDILASVKNIDATGSVTVTYNGVANSLLVYEGIEDRNAGYSASPGIMEINPDPSADPQPVTQVQLAAPGVMIGPPDPAMLFPAQTIFQPYAYLHNASSQPLNIDVLIAPIQGGAPAKLGTVALAAGGTAQADIVGMMRRLKVQPSGEYANLVFAYQGEFGDLIVETGSMDQTRNYVFEVAAVPEVTTISHTLCYWMISGDNDSMISIWNYTDKPSDELLTLFFARGQYKFPVHLAPGETKVLSVKSIQREQTPDVDGHIIPISITEGSALLSLDKGETEKMSVALSSASFNVRNATCGVNCAICNGVSQFSISPASSLLNVQQQEQMQGMETYNTGTVQAAAYGSWSSSAEAVATLGGTGIATGVTPGFTNGTMVISNVPVYAANVCTSSGAVSCPQASQMGASAPINVSGATVNLKSTGLLSSGDNLTFSSSYDCLSTLGAASCPAFFGVNVELKTVVPDAASNWTVTQSVISGRQVGRIRNTVTGTYSTFSQNTSTGPDGPLQSHEQGSGNTIFYTDTPGFQRQVDATDVLDSGTLVINFVTQACSKANPGSCTSFSWYVQVYVTAGAVLDTAHTLAAQGQHSTSF